MDSSKPNMSSVEHFLQDVGYNIFQKRKRMNQETICPVGLRSNRLLHPLIYHFQSVLLQDTELHAMRSEDNEHTQQYNAHIFNQHMTRRQCGHVSPSFTLTLYIYTPLYKCLPSSNSTIPKRKKCLLLLSVSLAKERKMASFVSSSKFSNHSRSISLPTSSHLILEETDKHLRRLKSSQGASSSSYTSTSQKLDDLRNVYECLEGVLQMPKTQQLLSREKNNGTWEEEILDGSLRLLDICNTTRDAYSMMKESVQELESCLRRKRGANLDNEIDAYMASKKKVNRVIYKCSEDSKRAEKRCSIAAVNNDNNEAAPLINQIKEAQDISLTLLQSSLTFISESRTNGRWSVVSKLLHQNKREAEVSEMQSIEVELLHLNSKKHNKVGDIVRTKNIVERVGALGESIQETVEVLDVILRLLIKARVSLLNILNN